MNTGHAFKYYHGYESSKIKDWFFTVAIKREQRLKIKES